MKGTGAYEKKTIWPCTLKKKNSFEVILCIIEVVK